MKIVDGFDFQSFWKWKIHTFIKFHSIYYVDVHGKSLQIQFFHAICLS